MVVLMAETNRESSLNAIELSMGTLLLKTFPWNAVPKMGWGTRLFSAEATFDFLGKSLALLSFCSYINRLSGLDRKLGASRLTKSLIHSVSKPSGMELTPSLGHENVVGCCAARGKKYRLKRAQNNRVMRVEIFSKVRFLQIEWFPFHARFPNVGH